MVRGLDSSSCSGSEKATKPCHCHVHSIFPLKFVRPCSREVLQAIQTRNCVKEIASLPLHINLHNLFHLQQTASAISHLSDEYSYIFPMTTETYSSYFYNYAPPSRLFEGGGDIALACYCHSTAQIDIILCTT